MFRFVAIQDHVTTWLVVGRGGEIYLWIIATMVLILALRFLLLLLLPTKSADGGVR